MTRHVNTNVGCGVEGETRGEVQVSEHRSVAAPDDVEEEDA
jgi:hypothetical protein